MCQALDNGITAEDIRTARIGETAVGIEDRDIGLGISGPWGKLNK
jgi:hypothetical protein